MKIDNQILSVLNVSPNAAALLDDEGKILFSNNSFKEIVANLSVNVEEVIDFDALRFCAASFGKILIWPDIRKQISTSEAFDMNINLLGDNDRVFSSHASKLSLGNNDQFLLFLNDITIQWRLEKKIAIRDSVLDRVISEFPSMICGLDQEGIIRVWNHRAADLTGYPAMDMIDNPKAIASLFPNQRYRYEILEKWNTREENIIRNWDMEVTCKNGATKIISWTVRYRENPIIEDIHHWAVGLDITNEMIALRALRMSEEKFRIISKSTNDALWDYDLIQGTLWWSEGITELFGYNSSEIEPSLLWWEDRIHPDYRQIVAKRFADFISEGGHFWTDEYLFRKNDNTYAFVVDKGYILRDNNGNPVRAIGGMTDLTNEKTMEELVSMREAQLKHLLENNSKRIKSPLSKVMQISKLLSIMKHERQEVKELTDQLLRSVHDLEVAIGTDDEDELD